MHAVPMDVVLMSGPNRRDRLAAAGAGGAVVIAVDIAILLRGVQVGDAAGLLPWLAISTIAALLAICLCMAARFHRSPDASRGLLMVAYLYLAAVVPLYYLVIPGVLTTHGLPGQTYTAAAWAWTCWHLGPALLLGAYAGWRALGQDRPIRRVVAWAEVIGAAALLAGISWAVVLPLAPHLPTIADPARPGLYLESGTGWVVLATDVGSVVALSLLTRWRTRADLWTTVFAVGMLADAVLGILTTHRLTFSWWSGRVCFLAVSCLFLVALLRTRHLPPS